MSDKLATLNFEPIDDFRKFIWDNFNQSSSNIDGYIDEKTLLNVLIKVEDEVLIYYEIISTFLHQSAFEILVFPKATFEQVEEGRVENIRFIGLATIHSHMLDKYLTQYHVDMKDFGFVQGKSDKVMSRFSLSKSFDNYLDKNDVKKDYKHVSLSELQKQIDKRKSSLGIV